MNHHGDFPRHQRDNGWVIKILGLSHPANSRLTDAVVAAGRAGAETYLEQLRAAGVHLPPGLAVIDDAPLAVGHRWVDGPTLLDSAAASPVVFAEAVRHIGQWVRRLHDTDARIDTNLANFIVTDGRPVLVDVLPPLVPSRRPHPATLFDELFCALCFDTEVILAALAGYAARAVLRSCKPAAAAELVPVAEELCPPVTRGELLDEPFPSVWFRARATLAWRALTGRIPADDVHTFFALTSVRAFRELDEQRRTARLRSVDRALQQLERP